MTAVWVTRPEPRNRRTAEVLREAGYEVIALPVLALEFVTPVSLPGPRWPDWIVFVSANAVEGLERAVKELGEPGGSRSLVRAAVVGARTAAAATRAGWQVELAPGEENAAALAEALHHLDLRDRSIWIPSGNRPGSATGMLPRILGEAGAHVVGFPVYANRPRRLATAEMDTLARVPGEFLVLHSPSAAEAVLGSGVPDPVSRWRRATVVTLGPSTTARARELGAESIIECDRPSDDGILEALEKGRR